VAAAPSYGLLVSDAKIASVRRAFGAPFAPEGPAERQPVTKQHKRPSQQR